MTIESAARMLDPLDLQLLALLEMDGRMSHARLARRVGRSRSAIRAYLLVSGSTASHEQLASTLQVFPEVRVCDSVTGELDLVLQLQAPDIAAVDRVRAAVAALPGVARTRTALVMQNRFNRR